MLFLKRHVAVKFLNVVSTTNKIFYRSRAEMETENSDKDISNCGEVQPKLSAWLDTTGCALL